MRYVRPLGEASELVSTGDNSGGRAKRVNKATGARTRRYIGAKRGKAKGEQ